jgi:hypothetical protein
MNGRRRPIVSLGDLIRAVDVLDADQQATQRIAQTLHVTAKHGGTRVISPADVVAQRPATATSTAPRTIGDRSPDHAPSAPKDDHRTSAVVPSLIRPVEQDSGPAGLTVSPLPTAGVEEGSPRPPHLPLLEPRWTRAILSSTLATLSDEGELDVDETVDIIAGVRPLDRLPRLPIRTMRRGVQLLLDRSPALLPYSRDVDWLADRVRRIGGRDRIDVRDFVACPVRRSDDAADLSDDPFQLEQAAYARPSRNTVVFAVTDLGIGRPQGWTEWAGVDEWLSFAAMLRKAACPLVAIVPYSSHRWSHRLARSMTILEFDRRTTASTVRRTVGLGHVIPA